MLERLKSVGVLPALLQSVHRGWDRWQKKVAPTFKAPTARSRASVVHDYIGEALESLTRGMKGVRVARSRGSFLLHVGADIVIEIHKLNGDRVPERNQTGFAEILNSQQLSNGLHEVLVLTLGYIPDGLAANLREVVIGCSRDGRSLWEIDLQKEAGATVQASPSAAPVQRKNRVTAKPGVKPVKKKESGEDEP